MNRCTDYRVINKIAGMFVAPSSDYYYLIDEGKLWTFEPYRDGYRMHANMTNKRGKQAIDSAKKAMEWMFENARAGKIYASVPVENKCSRMLVRHCMNFVGKDSEYHYYEAANV